MKDDNCKILIVGDIMLDEYVIGHNYRLSEEAPVPIMNVDRFEIRLGGAANVALNVAALGCTPILCGAIGLGYSANRVMSLLDENCISEETITQGHTLTTTKTRVIVRNYQVVRYDYEDTSLREDVLQGVCEKIKSVNLDEIDVIIVSDYDKGVITQQIMDLLKSMNKTIIVDPKPSNKVNFDGVFCLTPNQYEFFQMCGQEGDLQELALSFIQNHSLEALVITMQDEGALLCHNEKCIQSKGLQKEVANTIGAGDTFVSAFAVFLARGEKLEKSVALANLAAGIAVSKNYTSCCSTRELQDGS